VDQPSTDREVKRKAELRRFHEKIAALRFLDPACGCGNFLVVTYRGLRSLETEILKLLYPDAQQELAEGTPRPVIFKIELRKLAIASIFRLRLQFFGN
jgi:hypothetical protein